MLIDVVPDLAVSNRSTYLFTNVMEMFSDGGGGWLGVVVGIFFLIQSSKPCKTEQHAVFMRQWNVFFLSASEANQVLVQSGKYHL